MEKKSVIIEKNIDDCSVLIEVLRKVEKTDVFTFSSLEEFENSILVDQSISTIIISINDNYSSCLEIKNRIEWFCGGEILIVFAIDFNRYAIEQLLICNLFFLIKPFVFHSTNNRLSEIKNSFQSELQKSNDKRSLGFSLNKILVATKKQDFYLNHSDLLFVFTDHGLVNFVSAHDIKEKKERLIDLGEIYYEETSSQSRKEVFVNAVKSIFKVFKSTKDFRHYCSSLESVGFQKIGKSILINMEYLFYVHRDFKMNDFGWRQNRSICTLKKDDINITLPLEREYRMKIQKAFQARMS
ncbi:MAG: hypothetical protein ACEPOW_06270 [Bacteroidales bacterium]